MARVVIAGAGPTGLALALLLARSGINITLLEARSSLGGLFRGEALMPSGLEALARIGLWPLPPAVIQRPLAGWSFWLERRPWFQVEEPMGSGPACTLLDPCSLIAHLAELLQAESNASLRLGCGISEVIERDGRVVGVRLVDGEAIPADLVVACDGRGSNLRRSAGLELQGRQRPIDVLWFRMAEPSCGPLITALDGRFHTVLAQGRSLALYASSRGGVHLGLPLQPGERLQLSARDWLTLWRQLSPPALEAALTSVPPEAVDGPLRLPVQVGLAERWWRPGLLLLGDAAHPMSPIRAQGSSMGLRDALVAADHLIAALPPGTAYGSPGALDHALAAIGWRRRQEIAWIQRLQQQEWQRAERLAHSPPLRRLLAASPSWLSQRLAERWRHSQLPLQQGQAGALERSGRS